MTRRTRLVISAIVAAYLITLLSDVTPYVRGPDEWRWPRWPDPLWDKVWPLAIALILIGLMVWWIDRRASTRRWITLGVIALIVAAPIVQMLAVHPDRDNPFEALLDRAVDALANGYFTTSLRFNDANETLRAYPQLMPKFDVHAQVHPPGMPLIYWAAAQGFEAAPAAAHTVSQWFRQLTCNTPGLVTLPDAKLASALAGILIPLLANALTVWGVFKLSKDRFDARAGLHAAAMWVLIPSVVLFPGSWSVVYPCLACLTWLAVDAGLRRRNLFWFFVAGLLLSISTFLELGTVALGLFLTLYILACYVLERRNPFRDLRFLLPALIVTLVGLSSIWGAYQVAYGVSLKQIVEAMYPIHVGYTFNRWVWLINHPYEFAEFVGLPIFCWLVLVAARSIQAARLGRGEALSLSVLIGLIVLATIDPARDETARTWMLFMPLAVVAVSQLFAEDAVPPKRFGWLWGLMMVQTVVMLAVLHVMEVRLPGPPARSTSGVVPITATTTQADFDGMAQLIGYEIQREGDRLIVDWYWRGGRQIDYPYLVFNHLVNDQWQTMAQQDGRPQDGKLLMTCWQPGEVYRDRHVLEIAPDVPPGHYALEMGLYNEHSGGRVSVVGVNGSQADHLEIGPIELK